MIRKCTTIAMSEIKVCVSLLSGAQWSCTLPPAATVWDLRGVVKETLGVRRRYQQLIVAGNLVHGHCPLAQVAPEELTRIMLVIVETRACDACGTHGLHKVCAGCRAAVYCSPRCQRVAWRVHRRTCRGR